jgi:hypothetical protein
MGALVDIPTQKALLELATLHVPDELLNKETSGVEEVEAVTHLSSNNGPAPVTM